MTLRLQLADPNTASDAVRRDSQGLTDEAVGQARRIVRAGGVADSARVARLVMTLVAEERRADGSLAIAAVLAAGVGSWAVVRLLTTPWNAETWLVVVAAALQVPSAISSVRSRRRLPAVERDNASMAAEAGARAEALMPAPPVTTISLAGLLRRELPGRVIGGVLWAVLMTLTDGKSLTTGRVIGSGLAFTVLMTGLTVYRAWRRAHPDSEPGS